MKGMLTSSQVAERIGVSKSTIIRWSQSGWLPFFRDFGGQRQYHPKVIDQLKLRWLGGERNITMLRDDLFRLQDQLKLEQEQRINGRAGSSDDGVDQPQRSGAKDLDRAVGE
jgi:excisionase family DNA binding protein